MTAQIRQHMGKTIEHRPRFNPEVQPATWPFREQPKGPDDHVISNIGKLDFSKCRRDRFCRGRCCRPSLAGEG